MANGIATSRVVTLTDAAARLKWSYQVALRRGLVGELELQRIGSRWFVTLSSIERLERSRAPNRCA